MAAEALAAQLVYQTMHSMLITSAASTLAAGGSAAVTGTAAVTTATTLAATAGTIAVAPIVECAPLLLADLSWFVVGGGVVAAAIGGVALAAKGVIYICEKGYTYFFEGKEESNANVAKNKEKVGLEVDPFSSESVEEMVANLFNHLQEPLNKVDEHEEKMKKKRKKKNV
uniref:(northern house mosquito) hypothetical protein n=1 Tax=Culex pipiens TaxID=7175 RepID=A0A8D8GGA1_CULPI